MTTKREIEPIDWIRYQTEDGKRLWWHPDDEPPTEGKVIEDDCFSSIVTLRYRLDPTLNMFDYCFDELYVLWSDRQCCYFLLAYGVDNSGEPEELRISVNLLPRYSTSNGFFYCRDEDFTAPLVRELCNREILKPTGKTASSGFIEIPMFRFTPILEVNKV
jgi:hypothetical protein